MLSYYYGLEHKENFEKLFGNRYIGRNPSPLANAYLVLNFDFSGINTTTFDSTLQGFFNKVVLGISNFLDRYSSFFLEEDRNFVLNSNYPNEILENIFYLCKKRKTEKIYLIIDEYDHFANEIIAFNYNDFSDIISRNGFVRKFYEVIKTATMEAVVDKIFITGVTPITLDSMTSGFNIARDLTMNQKFNEAVGFTFEEVKELVDFVCIDGETNEKTGKLWDKELMHKDLKSWYNGYLFNGDAIKRVYNANMVLCFLEQIAENNVYPKNMLDINIASDYKKIKNFFELKKPEQNYEVLERLLTEGEITSAITEKFSFERNFTHTDFASMLFYMGFVSIKMMQGVFYKLQMPNYVIQSLYFDFFVEILDKKLNTVLDTNDLQKAILSLIYDGNATLFAAEVQKTLRALSNRDAIKFSEKHLKVVVFTLLNLSRAYFIKSEYETEKTYVDILLLERQPFAVNFQYAIELKYLPKERAKEAETVKNQAIIQLNGYLQSQELRELKGLKSLIFIIVGDDLEMVEL